MSSEHIETISLSSINCSKAKIWLGSAVEPSGTYKSVAQSRCDVCQYRPSADISGKLSPQIAEGSAKSSVETQLKRRGKSPGVDCCLARFGSK